MSIPSIVVIGVVIGSIIGAIGVLMFASSKQRKTRA